MIHLTTSQLRRLQMIELELLMEVDRICALHGIRYQIIAGTMLGAVRNGGFIPWDDDADVALLRPEYERFREACRASLDTDRYYFQDMRTTSGYRWGYGKLRRKRTTFLREHQEHMPYDQGVFIDVFPLDAIPNSLAGRTLVNFECFLTRKMLWSTVGKVADPNIFKRLVYAAMDLVPRDWVAKHVEHLASRKHAQNSDWVRILTFPTPNRCFGYKRIWYQSSVPAQFEGITFPGVSDYDDYLSFKYGSWREIPPPEQRKTHPVSDLHLLDDDEYAQVLNNIELRRENDRR